MSDPFERVLDEAGEQEAALMAQAKAAIVAAVDDGLARLRPSLTLLHKDALALFWNELATELERITTEVKVDRVTFDPLWSDLATELEHVAALKQRIVSLRSQIGDDHGPTH